MYIGTQIQTWGREVVYEWPLSTHKGLSPKMEGVGGQVYWCGMDGSHVSAFSEHFLWNFIDDNGVLSPQRLTLVILKFDFSWMEVINPSAKIASAPVGRAPSAGKIVYKVRNLFWRTELSCCSGLLAIKAQNMLWNTALKSYRFLKTIFCTFAFLGLKLLPHFIRYWDNLCWNNF